jgi:hypothetical protein
MLSHRILPSASMALGKFLAIKEPSMPWIERYRDYILEPLPASLRPKPRCQDCEDLKTMVLCLGITLAVTVAILLFLCYYVL